MEQNPENSVGGRLQQARNARGLTQTQVAEHCGFEGHAAIMNWEKRRNFPSLDALATVAELYGVSIDWICYGGAMSGIDAKVRKVPDVLRPSLIDRINQEISKTMDAAERLPPEMRGAHIEDGKPSLEDFAAKHLRPAVKKASAKPKGGTQ